MGKFPYVREKPIMWGRGENCWGDAVGELGGGWCPVGGRQSLGVGSSGGGASVGRSL